MHRRCQEEQILRSRALKFRARQRLLSTGGTDGRMGADCAPGLLIALPQDWFHQRISGLGRRRQTWRTTFILGAGENAMGRAARKKCLLRTAKQPDPALPREIGKERTGRPVVLINLAGPVELIVLSVKQKAVRCRLHGTTHTVTLRAGRLAAIPILRSTPPLWARAC